MMHKYEYRKSKVCELYGIAEANGQKVDLHHLYSQNTINTLVKKETLPIYVGQMFRDSIANLYPLSHDQHIAKAPIRISTEFGSKEIRFPQWTPREFYLLTQHLEHNRKELVILNFGFDFVDGVFVPVDQLITCKILQETLSQVCLDCLGYLPDWVKE